MFDVPPPNEVRGTIVVVFSSRSGLAAPPVARGRATGAEDHRPHAP
jgi:hypothetical protein